MYLDIFENACEYFVQTVDELKNRILDKIDSLDEKDWEYDKGNVKVCSPDEKGRKKRCKSGLSYRAKIVLSKRDIEIAWEEFKIFFDKSYIPKIERISGNEEIGRYEFIASNSDGDEVSCSIFLPNEWNNPQINILAFVSSRFRKVDFID